MEWRTEAFPRFLLFCSVIAIIIFWSMLASPPKEKEKIEALQPNPFGEVDISAKSAFVWDVRGQKMLYGKNENLALPLASLTKVMTALTAEIMAEDMSTVAIHPEDLTPEGDTGLKVASRWNTSDLIDYLLLVSSNDGAKALAGAAGAWGMSADYQEESYSRFVNKMNALAKEIGLENSIFFNEHGLDRTEGRGGAYGSAKDMAKLFEYTLINRPHILEATKYSELIIKDLDEDRYLATNTNSAVNMIPSILASKTGYTDLAGGNLAVAFDAGLEQPIIITVLGSTQEGRFDDMLNLVEAAQKYISR